MILPLLLLGSMVLMLFCMAWLLLRIGKTIILKNAQNDCIDLVGLDFKIKTKHGLSNWTDVVDGIFIIQSIQLDMTQTPPLVIGYIPVIKIRGKKLGHIYDLSDCLFV